MIRLIDRVTGHPPGPVDPTQAFAELEIPAGSSDRPHTILNMIVTVDGKAVVGGPGSTWKLGSPIDHALFKQLRAQCDAVIAGAGVFLADDPPYPVIDEAEAARRQAAGLRPFPLYVAVTGRATLPTRCRVFRGGPDHLLVVASQGAPNLDTYRDRAQVLTMPGDRLDMADLARQLRARWQIRRLYCIGGPTLNASLVEDRVLDEIFVTVAPALQGGSRLPTMLEGAGPPGAALQGLHLRSAMLAEDELFLRYSLATR